MSQQITAGQTLPHAWTGAGGPPTGDRAAMSRELLNGRPFDEVLHNAPSWLPVEDRFLLSSFAQSGRLAEGTSLLAQKHALKAQQIREAWSAVPYPLAVLHFAILVLPLRHIVSGGVETYLFTVGLFLLPLWAVIGGLTWAAAKRHRWLAVVTGVLPWLRGYRRNLELADLAFALESLLLAGAPVDVAWGGAGRASGSRRLGKAAERVSEAARRGEPPGNNLPREGVFPEEFVSFYQIGERTGHLDQNLRHLAAIHRERAADKLKAASFWYPKFLFAAVAIMVAYTVVSFYAGYFRQIEEILQW